MNLFKIDGKVAPSVVSTPMAIDTFVSSFLKFFYILFIYFFVCSVVLLYIETKKKKNNKKNSSQSRKNKRADSIESKKDISIPFSFFLFFRERAGYDPSPFFFSLSLSIILLHLRYIT